MGLESLFTDAHQVCEDRGTDLALGQARSLKPQGLAWHWAGLDLVSSWAGLEAESVDAGLMIKTGGHSLVLRASK